MKKIIIWIFVVAAIIAAVVWFAARSETEKSPEQAASLVEVSASDWIKGGNNSNIVLIEYSDFQCPACAAYYPLLKQLSREFNNEIKFVYRHFPLRQIHDKADLSARAAEAAGRQGKFWEMHDLIFENQKDWSDKSVGKAKEIFTEYAQSLNLEIEKFKNDIDSKEVKKIVDNAYKSAVRLRLRGTPTFFLNGKKIQNPRSYEEFKRVIQTAIANNS